MSTYSMAGLADFILYIYKEEAEQILWETWLHKPIEADYKTFKEKNLKKRKTKAKELTKEEEQEIIKMNMKLIVPVEEGEVNIDE